MVNVVKRVVVIVGVVSLLSLALAGCAATAPASTIQSIVAYSPDIVVPVNLTAQLSLAAFDTSGKIELVDLATANVTMMSLDTKIATVDGHGLITGIKAGKAGIFVYLTTADNVTKTATVGVIVTK